MRDQEIIGLYEAYNQVYAQPPQEEVEAWVNALVEEGYDLSEYTWDDMVEIYLDEGRTTSLQALSRESQQRKADKERGRPETKAEIHGRLMMGKFRPGASREERAEGGRERLRDRGKVPQKGGKDMFEHILEYLVAEGYADTNKSALAIMANMSEEWKQTILEREMDEPGESDDRPDVKAHNRAVKYRPRPRRPRIEDDARYGTPMDRSGRFKY